MKIYTLVALAVFGSVCLIFGFFLGQHTYLDEKSVDLLKQGYIHYVDNTSEAQDFRSTLQLVQLVETCKNEDCSEVIEEVYKPLIKATVEKYDKGEFDHFNHIMLRTEIETAKEWLK